MQDFHQHISRLKRALFINPASIYVLYNIDIINFFRDFLSGNILSGDFLSGDFLSRDILSWDILSVDFLSRDILSETFCPGTFCPITSVIRWKHWENVL